MRFKLKKFVAALFLLIIFLFYKQFWTILLSKRNALQSHQSIPAFEITFGQIWKGWTKASKPTDGLKRVDWHNYEQIDNDYMRTGPGENGKPLHPLTSEQGSDAYKENGFNIKVSNRISLDRSLPDIRTPQCKTRKYLAYLPSASIIIPFHNEGWTTLLRSIHSIINRTPPMLLHEIVLVDDFSNMNHLGGQLDVELAKYPKVKLIRLPKREGLIRARLTGVAAATGTIMVILDSHIEVTQNWLPPLIEPIALNRTTITCPMIDVIHNENFEYRTQPGDAMRGAFDWELYYKRIPIPADKQSADPSDPFEDPVMAGGLFAADRSYFLEIGQYDPGLEIWGGEQYELSFKVWMCGGRILDSPCSRVGHIYRKFVPYKSFGGGVNRNYKRVAEVWMDEYKQYLYKKRPHIRNLNMGDISEQQKLRERLKCKSFDWFMKEVAPDILKYYPAELPSPAAWGNIRNKATGECLEVQHTGKIVIKKCSKSSDQSFLLTWSEDIRPGIDMYQARSDCLDAQRKGQPISLYPCHQMHGNQLWKYLIENGQIYHSQTESCLTDLSSSNGSYGQLVLDDCKKNDPRQEWNWLYVDQVKLTKFNKHKDRAV